MEWYHGATLLQLLEDLDTSKDIKESSLRFPIQYVCRPRESVNKELHDFRAFMGRIESGLLKVNDKVKVLPSGRESVIKEIRIGEQQIEEAIPEQSITVSLADEIDISRGDMLVHQSDSVGAIKNFTGMVCWFAEEPLAPNRTYLIMHTTQASKAKITSINYKINIQTLDSEEVSKLQTNDIANISFKLAQPLVVDNYIENRGTGAFIIVDESTFHTVGAGMIELLD
jgi:sulfate adenylyltransferase subunit 1